jgi:hypothetical protein
VKVVELQHIIAGVETEIFLDHGAQRLQQAVPSRLVALRTPIYLDIVRQYDAPEKGTMSSTLYHKTPDRISKLSTCHAFFNTVKINVRAGCVIEECLGGGDPRSSRRGATHFSSRTAKLINSGAACLCVAHRFCTGTGRSQVCKWRL